MNTTSSSELFARAKELIPGGVNSPVRAFRSVGADPLFITKAAGCRITDADGNEFIDYVGSWGPMILGHCHPQVVKAVQDAAASGSSFGAPTELEITLAEMVIAAVPSIEMVRMVSSGTEATMSAIRLARGCTGRDKILKFSGCYHGHADSLLVKAGSGAATFGVPDSPGVPQDFAKHTLTARFNDLDSVRALFAENKGQVACIIVEPIAGNMGTVPPRDGFLEGLRSICTEEGAILIFDEVMSGFRVAYGGAQEVYGVTPDMTTLGKIIGGGLPVGAFGGKKETHGPALAVGRGLPGRHPLGQPAGHDRRHRDPEAPSASRLLCRPGSEERLPGRWHRPGRQRRRAIPSTPPGWGAWSAPSSPRARSGTGTPRQSATPRRLPSTSWPCSNQGIYLAPSQFETAFVSIAHEQADLDRTIAAARKAFKTL